MTKFKPVDSINGSLWYHTDDLKEYIKVYIWLTTTSLSASVDFENNILMGIANPIMIVEHHTPKNPEPPEYGVYWRCNSWIIRSYIKPDMKPGFSEKYRHFKMGIVEEYYTPPIPEYLVKLYYINNPVSES